MKLSAARIDVAVWSTIYGGLLLLGLGLALQRGEPTVGWWVAAGGVLAVLVGLVLILVRSRMRDPASPADGADLAERTAHTPNTPRTKP